MYMTLIAKTENVTGLEKIQVYTRKGKVTGLDLTDGYAAQGK